MDQLHHIKYTPHTITEPPPVRILVDTHLPFSSLTYIYTPPSEPNKLNLDSSDQIILFQSVIVQSILYFAQSRRTLLCHSVSNGYLLATLPFKPTSSSLFLTVLNGKTTLSSFQHHYYCHSCDPWDLNTSTWYNAPMSAPANGGVATTESRSEPNRMFWVSWEID